MNKRDRVDPEYRQPLASLDEHLPVVRELGDASARRASLAELARVLSDSSLAPTTGRWTDVNIQGPGSATHQLALRVYQPSAEAELRPIIYYIHGGGMWLGDLDSEHAIASGLGESTEAVVIAVDYRLAPEQPFPAAVDDCYAGLTWIVEHAGELGLDLSRLAIYGGSAGGGLAIATALKARDLDGPAIHFLMALYPMIDDRNETPSSREFEDLGGYTWDRRLNLEAWNWYLAGAPADQYAAPIRATDLSGLPATFIDVGALDLFRDENLEFASRLLEAGTPLEFHVYPGVFHGSEILIPQAEISQRILGTRVTALRRALWSTTVD